MYVSELFWILSFPSPSRSPALWDRRCKSRLKRLEGTLRFNRHSTQTEYAERFKSVRWGHRFASKGRPDCQNLPESPKFLARCISVGQERWIHSGERLKRLTASTSDKDCFDSSTLRFWPLRQSCPGQWPAQMQTIGGRRGRFTRSVHSWSTVMPRKMCPARKTEICSLARKTCVRTWGLKPTRNMLRQQNPNFGMVQWCVPSGPSAIPNLEGTHQRRSVCALAGSVRMESEHCPLQT